MNIEIVYSQLLLCGNLATSHWEATDSDFNGQTPSLGTVLSSEMCPVGLRETLFYQVPQSGCTMPQCIYATGGGTDFLLLIEKIPDPSL